MQIKSFDRNNLRELREAITAALEVVGKQYGIKITAGSASYMNESATFKVELATVTSDGTAMTKEASAFKRSCGLYGLKPEHLFAEINYAGSRYKITGLTGGRSWKYPIAVERIPDGKRFKLPESAVASLQNKTAAPSAASVGAPQFPVRGTCQNEHAMLRTAKGVEVGKCDQPAQTTRKVGGLVHGGRTIQVCLSCADMIDEARRENEAEAHCS
jgi:hypothetical protein